MKYLVGVQSRVFRLTRQLFAIAVLVSSACGPPLALGPIPVGIQTDVAFIASPQQEGRPPGSAGSRRVGDYLVKQYKALGLRGIFGAVCPERADCGDGFFQPFSAANARNARNVGTVILGSDASVVDEYVVVGAHYDHIGRSTFLSLDPEAGDVIRPGADDNASGTAAVLELARRLSAKPPRRSVILLNFDAEELGMFGSAEFFARPIAPKRAFRFMVNLDMVGRLGRGPLEIDRSTLMYDAPDLLAMLDSASRALTLPIKFTNSIEARSDHATFRLNDVSAIALFTGFHGDYHRSTDTVGRLDVRGIGLVTDLAEAVVRFEANRR
jgi:hypothetical protein